MGSNIVCRRKVGEGNGVIFYYYEYKKVYIEVEAKSIITQIPFTSPPKPPNFRGEQKVE